MKSKMSTKTSNIKSTKCLNNQSEHPIEKLKISELDKNGKGVWYVYFCAFTANLLLFSNGICLVWISPTIAKLQSNNPSVNPLTTPITTTQVSFIASILYVGSFFGSFIMAKVSDALGRKVSMVYIAIFTILSFLIIAIIRNFYVYLFFMYIVGINATGVFLNVPIYNSEIADSKTKAKLGCFVSLGIPSGALFGFIVGPIITFEVHALICGCPALLFLLLSYFICESPVYLALKNKKYQALQLLEQLRGHNNKEILETEYKDIAGNKSMTGKKISWDIIRNKSVRKAFFLSELLCVGQQVSGISIMSSFVAQIFNEVTSGYTVGIIVGLLQVIMFFVAAFVVDKFGRRLLMLFSSFFCTLFMFILGFNFYLKYVDSPVINNLKWLPCLLVILFLISYGIGFGPIPISTVSELFPSELRSLGVAVVLLGGHCVVILQTFSFPFLAEAFGIYSCMLTHGILNLLSFICLYLFFPETTGKTFSEIQDLLKN